MARVNFNDDADIDCLLHDVSSQKSQKMNQFYAHDFHTHL